MAQVSLDQLKAEALALAAELGRTPARTRTASAILPGTSGRRRSGSGDNFWQYRRYRSEDGAQRVDWRRSARDDKLFVRETELETARTFLFWVDPSEGFGWSGEPHRATKADRARVLFMALAAALGRGGERCGVLGAHRGAASGQRALRRVAEDLNALRAGAVPPPPREDAAVFVASDFYEPVSVWRERLGPLAARSRNGVVLAIADPVEETFPFSGRVRFFRPGQSDERLIGRSEGLREAYLERFAARRADMSELAAELGWRMITHSTAEAPRATLGALAAAVQAEGSAT